MRASRRRRRHDAAYSQVKLHGDYADLQVRNTVEELGDYPDEWKVMLARIGDEYGLLVSGWSADWDVALVRALEEIPSRRYPLYWDSRSSKGGAARRLVAQHRGHVIQAPSADELFGGLLASVDALDRLAEPPMTTAMAVARLKRYLPDPVRRIDLHDLVTDRVDAVADQTAKQPVHRPSLDHQGIQDVLAERLADVTPVLHLLATGVAHDRHREHTDLWVAGIQRLVQVRSTTSGPFQPSLDEARHYPALLALRAAGVVAVHAGFDDVLLRLLTEPVYRDRNANNASIPAVHALHDLKVLDPDVVNGLPRWGGQRWLYPQSHLVRADLREVLRPWLPHDDDYRQAFNAYEYRTGLVVHTTQDVPGAYKAAPGEYIGERAWNPDGRPYSEIEFVASLQQADDQWPWWDVVGGRDGWSDTLGSLRDVLVKQQRWG